MEFNPDWMGYHGIMQPLGMGGFRGKWGKKLMGFIRHSIDISWDYGIMISWYHEMVFHQSLGMKWFTRSNRGFHWGSMVIWWGLGISFFAICHQTWRHLTREHDDTIKLCQQQYPFLQCLTWGIPVYPQVMAFFTGNMRFLIQLTFYRGKPGDHPSYLSGVAIPKDLDKLWFSPRVCKWWVKTSEKPIVFWM